MYAVVNLRKCHISSLSWCNWQKGCAPIAQESKLLHMVISSTARQTKKKNTKIAQQYDVSHAYKNKSQLFGCRSLRECKVTKK